MAMLADLESDTTDLGDDNQHLGESHCAKKRKWASATPDDEVDRLKTTPSKGLKTHSTLSFPARIEALSISVDAQKLERLERRFQLPVPSKSQNVNLNLAIPSILDSKAVLAPDSAEVSSEITTAITTINMPSTPVRAPRVAAAQVLVTTTTDPSDFEGDITKRIYSYAAKTLGAGVPDSPLPSQQSDYIEDFDDSPRNFLSPYQGNSPLISSIGMCISKVSQSLKTPVAPRSRDATTPNISQLSWADMSALALNQNKLFSGEDREGAIGGMVGMPHVAKAVSGSEASQKKVKRFTDEEDGIIDHGVSKFGQNWEEIVRWSMLDRTADQIKGRYKRLGKKKFAHSTQGIGPNSGNNSPMQDPGARIRQRSMSVEFDLGYGLDHRSNDNSPEKESDIIPNPKQLQFYSSEERQKAPIIAASQPFRSPPQFLFGPTSQFGNSHSSIKIHPTTPSAKKITAYFTSKFPPPADDASKDNVPRISAEEVLKGELVRKEETITHLERRVRELTDERDVVEHEFEYYRKEVDKGISEMKSGAKDRAGRVRQVLEDVLSTQSTDMAREKRRKCNEGSLRLASLVLERTGLTYHERWQEGYGFKEIEQGLARINKEREDLEKRKKSLAKRKSQSRLQNTVANETEELLTTQDVHEMEEVFRMRLTLLKKEEVEFHTQREKLELERDSHIREMRRIRDEDASRFSPRPTLHERYLLLELLGKGGFSEVWKAFDLVELVVVGCKIHAFGDQWSEERKKSYIKHALREYQIHKALNHPRVVQLSDVFEIDHASFCTVLDYCDGKDLETYLQTQKTLAEKEARTIILQVFSGLKYLNELEPPVVHYDLKPGNILFNKGEVKITDFGLSKVIEGHNERFHITGAPFGLKEVALTSQGAGTYYYLPPECFERGTPMISSKVDVWSCGIIFYEMLFGQKPFGNDKSQMTILKENTITTDAHMLVFPQKPAVSQETKDFIRRCLEYRKEKRADVLTLWNVDPYLNPAVGGKGGNGAVQAPKSFRE